MLPEIKLAEELLRVDEGYSLTPYLDTEDNWTVGIGHLITETTAKIYEEKPLTPQEVDNIFQSDVAVVIGFLNKYCWYKSLNDSRKACLIDLGFALGEGKFKGFTNMIRALEKSDFMTAAEEIIHSLWAIQVGGRALRLARIMRIGSV